MGVDAAWDRIEAWLKSRAKVILKSLKPGAKPREVEKLEAALGVNLPSDFTASIARHNGQSDEAESGLIPNSGDLSGSEPAWGLLPIDEIKATWEQLKALADAGEFVGQVPAPAPGVSADWWCTGWVPFADNGGGDHLCLDLSPAEGGKVGQIVLFLHDARERSTLAVSFEELLSRVADELDAGQYIFEPDLGLIPATRSVSNGTGANYRSQLVILLPVERPTPEQLKVVRDFSRHQHANLLEIRQLMIAGGFRDFRMTMDPGLTQLVTRLEQANIPYRLEPLP